MSEQEPKKDEDRIQADLKRGLKYIEEASVDQAIKDFKIRSSQGIGIADLRSTRNLDGTENLRIWWEKNYPTTM